MKKNSIESEYLKLLKDSPEIGEQTFSRPNSGEPFNTKFEQSLDQDKESDFKSFVKAIVSGSEKKL